MKRANHLSDDTNHVGAEMIFPPLREGGVLLEGLTGGLCAITINLFSALVAEQSGKLIDSLYLIPLQASL
jgi:hypothetical protein